MSDVRPFEEYKEMIKDMPKEEMIKGLYDLSARVTKQESIIKEVREYIENAIENDDIDELKCARHLLLWNKDLDKLLEILDKENKQ